ncbi:MAG: hypothetical protein HWD59_04700 [Coxiellaceae bacterium]|nr:MAG: hypothetical protein HWD59_04700 [Coxiellaceae bacterium]
MEEIDRPIQSLLGKDELFHIQKAVIFSNLYRYLINGFQPLTYCVTGKVNQDQVEAKDYFAVEEIIGLDLADNFVPEKFDTNKFTYNGLPFRYLMAMAVATEFLAHDDLNPTNWGLLPYSEQGGGYTAVILDTLEEPGERFITDTETDIALRLVCPITKAYDERLAHVLDQIAPGFALKVEQGFAAETKIVLARILSLPNIMGSFLEKFDDQFHANRLKESLIERVNVYQKAYVLLQKQAAARAATLKIQTSPSPTTGSTNDYKAEMTLAVETMNEHGFTKRHKIEIKEEGAKQNNENVVAELPQSPQTRF